MITSKKQKLIKAIKTLKESQVVKQFEYTAYGPKKEKLYCFNGWMYKSLYPKTTFKTLMTYSATQFSKALTEGLLMQVNITHSEYIHKLIDFKTAIKLITEEINSS